MLEKFKSRKFILALIGQIVGMIVLFLPEYEGPINEAANNIGALLLMALTAAGYIRGEASIDAAYAGKSTIDPPTKQA